MNLAHIQGQTSVVRLQDPLALAEKFSAVRRASKTLCEPLEIEDYCIQSMPDVSPTKWHLAHTSWFFETFVLKQVLPGYHSPHPQYAFLFNSYYNAVGKQHLRLERGLLSRPTVAEIMAYRAHVDQAMGELFAANNAADLSVEQLSVIEIGLHHEQQHQELMLMDIKHVFSSNPLFPAYRELPISPQKNVEALKWIHYEGGLQWMGHDKTGFAYDNESPRHRTFVHPFQIANRLITCGEYLRFIEDRGYERPELWLSDGWSTVQSRNWSAPLYWYFIDGQWQIMTLGGMRKLNPSEPVCHVSFYEADAYARWMGCSLPREDAWEIVASELPVKGNFIEQDCLHPLPLTTHTGTTDPAQMFGDVWEWTSSPYCAYLGYLANQGALGEYNGKFMCNQMVLRGGACVTSIDHIRATYRNFFPADARWPFTGIRLAKEMV